MNLPATLSRPLVNNAARIFSLPAKLLPFTAQKAVLNSILHTLFAEALADGDFEFLEGHWLKLEIRDLSQTWYFTSSGEKLKIQKFWPTSDVLFSANLNDLVLIAARKADPDTLFFQRRLRIEGNTELGLEIKNLIDSIDLETLPGLLNRLMNQCADMIQQVELDEQRPC